MANRFGTTEAMVIQELETGDGLRVVAIDEKGLYLTSPQYVRSPVADPNRYSSLRRAMPERLVSLGLNVEELFEQNKHLIVAVGGGEAKKKVNPLKASKRGMK